MSYPNKVNISQYALRCIKTWSDRPRRSSRKIIWLGDGGGESTAMNLPLFFFLLSFLRSTGWCRALGKSALVCYTKNVFFWRVFSRFVATISITGSSEGACPEETCFSSNRETCNFGSSECGNCFQGFLEVGKACIGKFFY